MAQQTLTRVGVVGLGAMGKNHARIYAALPGARLVGVSDTDEATAKTVAEMHGTKAFLSHQELFEQGLDAVSIAVPTSSHREICLAAAHAGIHVLVEKPIAESVESAEQMVSACRRNNVKLMVGHVERFNPVTHVVKSAMQDCEVLSVTITRLGPFPPRIRDVGVVLDLAIHDIDLARYLTGSEFKSVYSLFSRSGPGGHEDNALLSFEMQNGVLVQLTENWLTPFKVREINVATREKYVRGWLQEQKVWEYRHWREDGSYVVKELAVPFGEPLRSELETFLKCVRGVQEVPVSGEEGLMALKTALQCLRPARE